MSSKNRLAYFDAVEFILNTLVVSKFVVTAFEIFVLRTFALK